MSKARTLHLLRSGNERGSEQFRHQGDKEDKYPLSNILRHLLEEAKMKPLAIVLMMLDFLVIYLC